MKQIFLSMVVLIGLLTNGVSQIKYTFQHEFPDNIGPAVFLPGAKAAFKKFNVKITGEGRNYVIGTHNQKTIEIGSYSKQPELGYMIGEGYPENALMQLGGYIRDFIENARQTSPDQILLPIELDIVPTSLKAHGNLITTLPKLTKPDLFFSEGAISVVFANVPEYADQMVVAKKNAPPHEWVNTPYPLKNLTPSGSASAYSGIAPFGMLTAGDYEVRVLSQLTQVQNGKRFRILQDLPFKVEKKVQKLGGLDIKAYHSDCNGKGYPVKVTIKIFQDGKLIRELKTDNKTNEIPGQFPKFISTGAGLLIGDYDVEFNYHFAVIERKSVHVRANMDTEVTAGKSNGRLSISFNGSDQQPVNVRNCRLSISSNNKVVFSKEYTEIKTESGELPEGNYSVKAEYGGKSFTREITITPCNQTFINFESEKADVSTLKLQRIDCNGRPAGVYASIYEKGKRLFEFSPGIGSGNLNERIANLKPGQYDIAFYSDESRAENNYTHIVRKQVDVKPGSANTVSCNENELGKLNVKFNTEKDGVYRIEIVSLEGEKLFTHDLKNTRSASESGILRDDNVTGFLYPGRYKVQVSISRQRTLIKEINITACQETVLRYPEDMADQKKGVLEIKQLDCPGGNALRNVEIIQNDLLVHSVSEEKPAGANNKLTYDLPEGKYDIIFNSGGSGNGNGYPYTYVVKKNIEVLPAATTTITWNKREMGTLSLQFKGKTGGRINYSVSISTRDATPFYNMEGIASYVYSTIFTAIGDAEMDKITGMIFPGKYTLIVESDEDNKKYAREITIEPCHETVLSFPDKESEKPMNVPPVQISTSGKFCGRELEGFFAASSRWGEFIGEFLNTEDGIRETSINLLQDELIPSRLLSESLDKNFKDEFFDFIKKLPGMPAEERSSLIIAYDLVLPRKISDAGLKSDGEVTGESIFYPAYHLGQVYGKCMYLISKNKMFSADDKDRILESFKEMRIEFGLLAKCFPGLVFNVLDMKKVPDNPRDLMTRLDNELTLNFANSNCCLVLPQKNDPQPTIPEEEVAPTKDHPGKISFVIFPSYPIYGKNMDEAPLHDITINWSGELVFPVKVRFYKADTEKKGQFKPNEIIIENAQQANSLEIKDFCRFVDASLYGEGSTIKLKYAVTIEETTTGRRMKPYFLEPVFTPR